MESLRTEITSPASPIFQSRKGLVVAVLATAAVIALVLSSSWGELRCTHRVLVMLSTAGVVVLGGLWHLHLNACGRREVWLAALPPMLSLQLACVILVTSAASVAAWLSAMGSGIFVYFMLWTLAAYERERGLQPLASGALLLSGGIITKPAVALTCLLLSLILFLLRGRRHDAGLKGFALLLFTPAVLTVISVVILFSVAGGQLGGLLAIPLAWRAHGTYVGWGGDPILAAAVRSGIAFSLAVTLSRILDHTAGISDVAYGALLVILLATARAQCLPIPVGGADLAMITYAGGAVLAALAPPRAFPSRALVALGACGPWAYFLTIRACV